MREPIKKSVKEAIQAIQTLASEEGLEFLEKLSWMIIDTYRQGGKLLIAGNGGSLCDAMHFAEEMTGFFRAKRQALPAIALSDPGHMSCVANDLSFDDIFARGVQAHGKKGDLFIALTTSGNSENLLRAVEASQKKGVKTVAFLGKTGGKMKGLCDLEWIVSGFKYSDRIQEAHMAAIHIVIEMVEAELMQHAEEIDLEPAGAH
ncbi:D-sedoheptulose-7-phosphate isomerase [Simkania sp.]|uniref:D-sedoheptulose-7-phosphate isomerase n=1 Tax=Simkania sp. TaxID=34094 RepID=UPI003B525786